MLCINVVSIVKLQSLHLVLLLPPTNVIRMHFRDPLPIILRYILWHVTLTIFPLLVFKSEQCLLNSC